MATMESRVRDDVREGLLCACGCKQGGGSSDGGVCLRWLGSHGGRDKLSRRKGRNEVRHWLFRRMADSRRRDILPVRNCDECAIQEDSLSMQDDSVDCTLYRFARNRRPIVAAFREDGRAIDDHFDLRVGLLRKSEAANGVVVETLLDVLEREVPLRNRREQQRKRLFYARPRRSLLPPFHADVERRPVDRESIDDLQVLPDEGLVVRGRERLDAAA